MSDEKSSAAWAGVPVAWAAVASNGTPLWLSYDRRDAGMPIGGRVIPLYSHRSPTLTDAEREAIEAAACICEDAGRTDIAIVINVAMARLGGAT